MINKGNPKKLGDQFAPKVISSTSNFTLSSLALNVRFSGDEAAPNCIVKTV
jgi:hypothetical protein